MKNNIIKKVLLVTWLFTCTAIFIYFTVMLIKYINGAIEQILYLKNSGLFEDMDIEQLVAPLTQAITQNIYFVIFLTLLYASFLALAIPKTIVQFIKKTTEQKSDIDTNC